MSTRQFSRVPFHVEATVRFKNRSFTGSVENLSMTGMFLVTEERLTGGDPVEVTVILSGVIPELAVHLTGTVTRVAEHGAGLTFEKIGPDSYLHLKNIIAYNSEDAEKVMEEIAHSIDEKIALDTLRSNQGSRKVL